MREADQNRGQQLEWQGRQTHIKVYVQLRQCGSASNNIPKMMRGNLDNPADTGTERLRDLDGHRRKQELFLLAHCWLMVFILQEISYNSWTKHYCLIHKHPLDTGIDVPRKLIRLWGQEDNIYLHRASQGACSYSQPTRMLPCPCSSFAGSTQREWLIVIGIRLEQQ